MRFSITKDQAVVCAYLRSSNMTIGSNHSPRVEPILYRTIIVRSVTISPEPPFARPPSQLSLARESVHAIATPRPTLLFAIASDDVNEVRRVLESGEASPNEEIEVPDGAYPCMFFILSLRSSSFHLFIWFFLYFLCYFGLSFFFLFDKKN